MHEIVVTRTKLAIIFASHKNELRRKIQGAFICHHHEPSEHIARNIPQFDSWTLYHEMCQQLERLHN